MKTTKMYEQDGLRSAHNHDFMNDSAFRRAHERGAAAAGGKDYRWHWRVHVGLWVASCARRLNGDFVECGVNVGIMSSAIMQYLDWNSRNKTFYLLDTFCGLDERYVSGAEKAAGAIERNQQFIQSGFYVAQPESVKANFSEWKNVRIIEGSVPETLEQVAAKEIAYLHLDMACALPEVAAAEFFWKRLVPGAFVLMGCYSYLGYHHQKLAMDSFARAKDIRILSLPTGQGLIIKGP